MSETKHAPGPLGIRETFIIDANGERVAELLPPNATDNGESIVRACNAHDSLTAQRDDLLAACELVVREAHTEASPVQAQYNFKRAAQACAAAIAKARPVTPPPS